MLHCPYKTLKYGPPSDAVIQKRRTSVCLLFHSTLLCIKCVCDVNSSRESRYLSVWYRSNNRWLDDDSIYTFGALVWWLWPCYGALQSVVFSLLASDVFIERIVALLRWCPSVRLSGAGAHCDHTVHFSADFSLRLDSPMFWTSWHQSMSIYSQPSFSSSTWKRDEAWMWKLGLYVLRK